MFRAFGVKSHAAEKHRFGRCFHAISEIRCTSRKKVILRAGFNQRDRATRGFDHDQTHRKPTQKFGARGFISSQQKGILLKYLEQQKNGLEVLLDARSRGRPQESTIHHQFRQDARHHPASRLLASECAALHGVCSVHKPAGLKLCTR